MPLSNKKQQALGLMALGVILVPILAGAGFPISLSIGPGCTFGGVLAINLNGQTFDQSAPIVASGNIGGNCSAAGDVMYYWYAADAQPTVTLKSGTALVSSANTYSFSFDAPTVPPTVSGFDQIDLFASLCPEPGLPGASNGCPSAISGIATTSFQVSDTGIAPPTYSLTLDFVDSSTNAGIPDVSTDLYSGSGSNLVQVGSQVSGPTGVVVFPGLAPATYSAVIVPGSGSGPYPSYQAPFTVTSTGSNSVVVQLTKETVTTTSTTSSTSHSGSSSTTKSTSTTVTTGTNGQKTTVVVTTGSNGQTTSIQETTTLVTQTGTSTGSNGQTTTTTNIKTLTVATSTGTNGQSTTTTITGQPSTPSNPLSQSLVVNPGIPLLIFFAGLWMFIKKPATGKRTR